MSEPQTPNRLADALKYAAENKRKRESATDHRFVYLIRCEQFYKIGIATDVQSRALQMQIGNPFHVVVMRQWPCDNAQATEEALHSMFDRWRHRGEWFKLPKDVVDAMCRIKDIQELVP